MNSPRYYPLYSEKKYKLHWNQPLRDFVMLYHIILEHRKEDGECRIDLSEEELLERYVVPYAANETLVINGKTMLPEKIYRVIITSSEKSLIGRIMDIKVEDKRSQSPWSMFSSTPTRQAILECANVTDKYITKAPGSIQQKSIEKTPTSKDGNENTVFVVHGHDTELKNDVELFLRKINLNPIVLHRKPDEGQTIIEKFEKHSNVSYAIILLTPDDIGCNTDEFQKNEDERELEYRARQNVIFEFGFFVGRLTRKNVCCIYKKGVKLPSDLDGLIYKEVDKTVEEVGIGLMEELKIAGLKVKYE